MLCNSATVPAAVNPDRKRDSFQVNATVGLARREGAETIG